MNKDRHWLYIAILALILALSWVGVSAWERLRTSTVPPDIEKVASPLDPNIDQSIFSKLSERKGGT